jgi:hypothetical protein
MPIPPLCFRWDLFLLDRMPEHIKICFLGLYNLVNEIAEEGRKRQGHDVLGYIRNLVCIKLTSLILDKFYNISVLSLHV